MATKKSSKAADARAKAIFDAHFEFHARYGGDEAPKNSAAEAKRIATSLRKAVELMGPMLEPKELAALSAAAGIMAELGRDLDTVCETARRHKTQRAADDLANYNSRVDQAAQERWGDNESAMLDEARELALFVDQGTTLDVAVWLGTQHPGAEAPIYPDRMIGTHRQSLDAALHAKPLKTLAVRRLAGEYILILRDAMRRKRAFQNMWYLGLDDFEAWRAWRKEISKKIVPAR